MSDFYDREGKPISMDVWLVLHNPEYIRVKLTEIGDLTISTVWLGLDHAFNFGPPLIFETMIFGGPDVEEEQYRYSTEEQALAHHDELVAQITLLQEATS